MFGRLLLYTTIPLLESERHPNDVFSFIQVGFLRLLPRVPPSSSFARRFKFRHLRLLTSLLRAAASNLCTTYALITA